jgi:hypothetical protein
MYLAAQHQTQEFCSPTVPKAAEKFIKYGPKRKTKARLGRRKKI